MTCRDCGIANVPGAKFCIECGAPQSAACPGCGAAVVAGAKFCAECGHRLADAASGSLAHAAGAAPDRGRAGETERRLVTVLFADLVGFTALSEGRDAEAVRDLLGRYFEVSREIVRRYGGTIEKFIGDAVMAVWGTPVAHEDDAERAVRAGLDLLDAIATLGSTVGAPGLVARVGVLTGEAAVNLAAVDQGMVAGDLVNTASRLQSAAQPGMVLVGEATMRAASGAIAFEPAGEQVLKGKAAPVPAWRAMRVVAQARGRGRADVLEPPFVGRDTEFRLLRELFHATGRERRARLVSLTGQAGIGKSRLAWEFSKYTDGLVETILWHEGRTPSYGEGVSFWALGEMVRKRAGLLESDDEATTRGRISAMLDEYVPDPTERAFIEPAVLALLGIGAVPAGGRDHLFAAWRALFERVAEQGTVALVFEDLHWADDGLLDFIEHLLEWSRNHPIFVVTLARPELLDRRPTWGSGQRNGTALPLGPLSEAEIRSMLTGVVPGLPEAAILTILERADGIPLYAVETIRTLVADGRLAIGDDGRYTPVGELGTLDVPDSLRGLIAARLDALPPADRSLVADGAVLGKTFTVDALAAVSGEPVTVLESRLRELDRLELLELNTDPRSPERGQYGFVQSLIREVAYGTLARRDRRTKHLAAARYFEGLGEDELAGALATHYLAAWQALPEGDEGAAVAVQAGISLRAAADRALALGSPTQALAHLDHAANLPGVATADQATMVERAGEAARIAGRYDVALDRYTRAVELRRTLDDQDALAAAIAGAGEAHARAGRAEAAEELLTAGLREVPEADGPGLVALLGRLTLAYRLGFRQEEALATVERMLQLAERLRLQSAVLQGISLKGALYSTTGRLIEGEALVDGGRRMAEAAGLTREAAQLLNQQVSISGDEDPGRSVELAREATALARRLGDMNLLVNSVLNGMDAAVHTGDWTWARGEAEALLVMDLAVGDRLQLTANARVFDLLRRRPDERLEGTINDLLAGGRELAFDTFVHDIQFWPAWLAGDYDHAIDLAMRIAEGDSLNAPPSYERAIRAAAWKGDAVRARTLFDALVDLARRGGTLDASRLGSEATVAALEGRHGDAERLYREALARFRSIGSTFDVAQFALDAAVVLGSDHPFGREMAAVARPILEQLGARPYLDRLDAHAAAAGEPAEARLS